MLATSLVATLLGLAPMEGKLLRYPAVHGDTVAFVYAGDIWTAPLDGSAPARRLTTSNGSEVMPRFSPDGSMVSFGGQYDSAVTSVYVMPVDGGSPRRLTYQPVSSVPTAWTRDGRVSFASSYGAPFTQRLWIVDPKGGMPQRTDLSEYTNGTFSPDGKQVVYNRANSYLYNWRYYRGGTQGRLSFWDFEKKAYWEAPSDREQNYWPMWIGSKVYFLSDRSADKNLNLWSFEPASKKFEQLTKFADGDIKNPSSDDKTIVFERNGDLFRYDIASKRTSPIKVSLVFDEGSSRSRFRRFGNSVGEFSISPSAKRVAVEARGELFTVPAKNGPTRQLTSTPAWREKSPSWAPDGQTIAFLSDQTGEWKIWTRPQMGGDATMLDPAVDATITSFDWSPDGKKLTVQTLGSKVYIYDLASRQTKMIFENPGAGVQFDWSPDGNWIAYTKYGPNLFSAVHLYNVQTGTSTQVTEGYYNDSAVSFDLNGKYLYLVSARTYGVNIGEFEIGLHQQNVQRVYALTLAKDATDPLIADSDEEPVKVEAAKPEGEPKKEEPKQDGPKPIKVDLDGLADRIIPLPWPPATYQFLVGVDNGVLTIANGALVKFDMGSRQPQTIVQGATGFSFTPKRDKMAYRVGGAISIADVKPGADPNQGRVSTDGVAFEWQPRDEWRQMFWEAWRHQRDNFYDPKMLGLNWKAIGDKYAALLPYVSNRSDLSYLLGLMVGELGTGHAYVQGGELGFDAPNVPVGLLGADYEPTGGKVRIAKIYRGQNFEASRRGPLGAPGVDVRDGDYLLAIDGQPVAANEDLHKLLINKVDVPVTLTVSSTPSESGARKVTVRPIASESGLRYIDWVETNRAYVKKVSNGRIGYMHVPDTNFQGIIEFMKGYYSNSGAEAFVIDERYNGGGFIPTFFIDFLMRRPQTVFAPRYGPQTPLPSQTLNGPMAMLINQFAGSGGDMLPWLFKRNNMGPLIGVRTWGGLVGIQGSVQLVDGGGVTAPAFGIYDLDKTRWIAENTGVDPDIPVDARPDLIAQGKDPILDRALEYLNSELAKNPRRDPQRPDFPRIGGGG
ncbi:MAG: PD40 domain-containing protein [Fimbriimonadaceae bacterium]|nr:PD40 domain-containing protein [Fimbriimonadaceae bacterium]QYK56066.1 MAG: PD40 domain-containing protein [Fimbriimonadaceae bacterium]